MTGGKTTGAPFANTDVLHVAIVDASPKSLDWPTSIVGQASGLTQDVFLTDGGDVDLVVGSVSFTGPDAADFSATDDCPRSSTGKKTCTIEVTFTPHGLGDRHATMEIADNGNDSPRTVELTGQTRALFLDVAPSGDVPAGQPTQYSAAARDALGHVIRDVTDEVDWEMSDGSCGSDGMCTPSSTGEHTVTATGFGASGASDVQARAADHLQLTVPETAVAGEPFAATATALDGAGTVGVYRDTVTLTSSDPASLSLDVHEYGAADAGEDTFLVTLFTAGEQSVTATDTALLTDEQSITVTPGAPETVRLSPAVASILYGDSQSFNVIARDPFANEANVTDGSVLTIAPDGFCVGATCTPADPGQHTVEASYLGITGRAKLTMEPLPGPTPSPEPTPSSTPTPTPTPAATPTATPQPGGPAAVPPPLPPPVVPARELRPLPKRIHARKGRAVIRVRVTPPLAGLQVRVKVGKRVVARAVTGAAGTARLKVRVKRRVVAKVIVSEPGRRDLVARTRLLPR